MKIILTALMLTAAPITAMAQCQGDYSSDQAMSCAQGTQWDDAQGTCIPIVAS